MSIWCHLYSFTELTHNVPPPKTYKYSDVKNKKFPENVMTIELSKYPNDILFERQDDDEYALVIRMERVMSDRDERRIFYNYFEFANSTGTAITTTRNVGLKLIRQKMEYNNQAFEIQEIYGINSSIVDNQANIEDTEKYCVICMEENIDTIILPCRHMSICIKCAVSFSKQGNRTNKSCPICRISTLLLSFVLVL